MTTLLKAFIREEDGNATIDWMVLTAGIVMLATAVLFSVGQSTNEVAEHAGEVIEQVEVNGS